MGRDRKGVRWEGCRVRENREGWSSGRNLRIDVQPEGCLVILCFNSFKLHHVTLAQNTKTV